jgi:hypothetical protein
MIHEKLSMANGIIVPIIQPNGKYENESNKIELVKFRNN